MNKIIRKRKSDANQKDIQVKPSTTKKFKIENLGFFYGATHDSINNGKGIFIFRTGAEYNGEWKDRQPHGQGTLINNKGETYTGDFVQGKQTGSGTMKFINKTTYEGEWLDYKRHGRGKLISAAGVFVGTWVNDLPCGFGEMRYINDDVYKGDWKGFMKHGHGKLVSNKGTVKYVGQFDSGKKNGHGKLISEEGTYEGNFFKNLRNGKGKMTFKNGDVYNGNWLCGLKNGKGELKFADGSLYIGDFYRDKQHGRGMLKMMNGETYSGDWACGMRHGTGETTGVLGRVKSEWVRDVMFEDTVFDLPNDISEKHEFEKFLDKYEIHIPVSSTVNQKDLLPVEKKDEHPQEEEEEENMGILHNIFDNLSELSDEEEDQHQEEEQQQQQQNDEEQTRAYIIDPKTNNEKIENINEFGNIHENIEINFDNDYINPLTNNSHSSSVPPHDEEQNFTFSQIYFPEN